MLIDMHSHSDGNPLFIQTQQENDVASILNATTTHEFYFNQKYAGPNQLLSYGIHPWKSQCGKINEELLTKAAVIGEIGLDTEWTDVPLDVQRLVFHQQLQFADEHHKPVILHTKGCEKEILDTLDAYPDLVVLVHWYSAAELQAEYIQRAHSYFSVGPDVLTDSVVQDFAQKIPADRLFIESDGLESFSWVLNRLVAMNEYSAILEMVYDKVAQLRHLTPEQLKQQLEANWQTLLNIIYK